MKVLAWSCPNGNCPNVTDPEDGTLDVLVQGFETDLPAPEGERIVRLPAEAILEAAQSLRSRAVVGRSPLVAGPVHDFNAVFDGFTSTAFRLETLQSYNVEEDKAAINAWRAGRARPEFSVHSSPWAVRLATSTIGGKTWRRVRVVNLPLSEYVRWEMAAYVESAVLGEEIRVLVRTSDFADLINDFWLFDAGESMPYVVAQHYDASGRPATHQLIVDRVLIATEYAALAERVWKAATPLNEWLVSPGYEVRGQLDPKGVECPDHAGHSG